MDEKIEFTGKKKNPYRLGSTHTVDAATGEVVEDRRNSLTLLPPKGDVCQECAFDHPHDQPHNQQSLYYQYSFYARHARWPTWTDAMSHCAPETQLAWRAHLVDQMRKNGMEIPGDLQSPGDEISAD